MRFPVSASVSVSLLLILLISKSSYGFTNIYGDNQGFTLIVSTNQITNQCISVFSEGLNSSSLSFNKKEDSATINLPKIVKEIKTGEDSSFILLDNGSVINKNNKSESFS